MTTFERIEKLRNEAGLSQGKLEKELGFSNGSISKWKNSNPTYKRLQKVADYFHVSIEYLVPGEEKPKEKSPELTARDEKDITKTLNKVMEQFENNENGPLYYDGEEIDETSRILIRNAFEYIIRETKKENKVKYNPNKNKTEK